MQNNTVLGLYNDESNNIWVALDNGISYVENNSLISVFVPDTKNFGVVYGYHAQDNINYFATNQGVYCYDESKKIFYSEESVNEQSWFVRSYYNQILCGNNKGLNLLKERKQISDIAGAMSSVRYHSENGEVLIVGTYSDLVIIIQDEHGSLNERNYINDVNLVSKHIEVDYKGRLWVQDMHKGIYRITLSSDLLNVDKKEKVALPSEVTGSVYLLKHDGLIVLSTSDGFFIPDHNDELIKHNSFNVLELGNIYPHQLTMVDRTLFWLSYDSFFRLISIDDDGVYNEVTRVSASLNGTATIENIATVVHNPNDNYSYFQLNGMLARTNPWTLTVKSLIRPLVVNQI